MKRVNVLDISIANKIAAGEVVERPSAVVKELVENSIDANSKNIIVEIKDGGRGLIKISDDGHGIHNEDIEKIFLPHATSKIQNEEDLYNIHSLGFRGEALPSIAAVSKVFIKSRSQEFDYGMSIQINGGQILEKKESASNIGTEIEIRELFYNTPARLKFLKTESRETAIIREIVTRLAISNYNISFEYIVNGKTIFKTTGTSLRDVIINIFGMETLENLFFIEKKYENLNIFGYIGDINFCKSSRNNQYFFVNNRIVKNKSLISSIENAYRNYMTINKFPFFILFLEINPVDIDVNIHPTKSEVKFSNEKDVYRFLYKTCVDELNDYLSNSNLTVEKNYTEAADNSISYVSQQKNNVIEVPLTQEELQLFTEKRNILDSTNPIIKENVPYNLVVDQEFNRNTTFENSKNFETKVEKLEENLKFEFLKQQSFPNFKIIGQYNNTYILAEWNNCLYLIDQHVAHEKALFESYINQIKLQNINRQIIIPVIINFEQLQYTTYDSNRNCFEKCGFLLEPFGEYSVIVREVPYEFKECNIENLIFEIIENIDNFGYGTLEEVKYNFIATKACKSAVKANCKLNIDEMKTLITKLKDLENPFTCPHGRPIIIKFTLSEIEKMFKRII